MCKCGVSVVLGLSLRVGTAENRRKKMAEMGKRASKTFVLRLRLYIFNSCCCGRERDVIQDSGART